MSRIYYRERDVRQLGEAILITCREARDSQELRCYVRPRLTEEEMIALILRTISAATGEEAVMVPEPSMLRVGSVDRDRIPILPQFWQP